MLFVIGLLHSTGWNCELIPRNRILLDQLVISYLVKILNFNRPQTKDSGTLRHEHTPDIMAIPFSNIYYWHSIYAQV